jgi:hypothetical protein
VLEVLVDQFNHRWPAVADVIVTLDTTHRAADAGECSVTFMKSGGAASTTFLTIPAAVIDTVALLAGDVAGAMIGLGDAVTLLMLDDTTTITPRFESINGGAVRGMSDAVMSAGDTSHDHHDKDRVGVCVRESSVFLRDVVRLRVAISVAVGE